MASSAGESESSWGAACESSISYPSFLSSRFLPFLSPRTDPFFFSSLHALFVPLSILLLPSLLLSNLSMPPKPRRPRRSLLLFPPVHSLPLDFLIKHRLLSFSPHQRFPTHSHSKFHSSFEIMLPHVSRRRDGSSHPLLCWTLSIELVRIFEVWERISWWKSTCQWRGSGEERGGWGGEEERCVC